MPELPEVELLARALTRETDGTTVTSADMYSFSALKTFDPPFDVLVGTQVKHWSRIGKMLIGSFDDLFLVVHFSRGGWVKLSETVSDVRPARKSPIAARVVFDGERSLAITEAGTEKRLAIHVVRDLSEVKRIEGLGLPVLSDEFTFEHFDALLDTNERIKNLLTNQHKLAGIGNAYSDEALHRAKLSPYATAKKLTTDERQRLFESIVVVLTEPIERGDGIAVSDIKPDKKGNMAVHGQTGKPCPVCGDTICEISFANRSWQYCPTCQTNGTILADRRTSKFLK